MRADKAGERRLAVECLASLGHLDVDNERPKPRRERPEVVVREV